jgi:FkbM family methyltransferase
MRFHNFVTHAPIAGTNLLRIRMISGYLSTARHMLADIMLPDREAWVRVRSGVAKGLWLRINLSQERNWWSGKHEPDVQQQLRECIHEGTVFYDIGGHIGLFSLAAARLGARVFAFEPDPETVARLQGHVDRNNLGDKITVVGAAVWSEGCDMVTFQRGLPRSQGGVRSHGLAPVLADGLTIDVDCVSLDRFVEAGGPIPNVIKTDVEGGEAEVLKGAVRTIRAVHPKLIVEIHHRDALAAVEAFLRAFSYNAEWRVPPGGFPRQCFGQLVQIPLSTTPCE